MKRILVMCLLALVGISAFASAFTIIAKGKDGATPAKGTIYLSTPTDTHTTVKLYISEIVHKEFSDFCHTMIVDEYTVRYAFNNGDTITVSQDVDQSDIFYFELPNFFEGQSGTIVYKVQNDK